MESVSFVICLEPGALEYGAVLLARSLRALGGVLSHAPIIAVVPRRGLPVSRDSRTALGALDVSVIQRRHPVRRYSWFNFLNKPLSLVASEEIVSTEATCWLDTDIVIAGDLSHLLLPSNIEFGAVADWKEQGTEGPGDPFESIWARYASSVGVRLDSLPWVRTTRDQTTIRAYYNGGMFIFRNGVGFPQRYLDYTVQMLDAQLRFDHPGFSHGFCEMSSLSMAAHSLSLCTTQLGDHLNYSVTPQSESTEINHDEEALANAKVIHYHNSLWPAGFAEFCRKIAVPHPALERIIRSAGPTVVNGTLFRRVGLRSIRHWRALRQSTYLRRCNVVSPDL